MVGRAVSRVTAASGGENETGMRGREEAGVTGSRSVTRRMVKQGGTATVSGVGRRDEVEEEAGAAGKMWRAVDGVGCDGDGDGDGEVGAGMTMRWSEVDSTWERAVARLE